MWNEIALYIKSGNPYVIIILLLFFVALVISFERLMMLSFVYNINFEKFLNNFKKAILSEDFDRGRSICKQTSLQSLPRIASRALDTLEDDPSAVRGTLEEDTMHLLPRIESRIGALPAISLLLMLCGILATVDSLWLAFRAIDIIENSQQQALITKNIAHALNPTALALALCSITLTCHYFLQALALKITEKIHYGVLVISNLLVPNQTTIIAAAPAAAKDSTGDGDDASLSALDEGTTPDEDFDDDTVEDIKDEEEII